MEPRVDGLQGCRRENLAPQIVVNKHVAEEGSVVQMFEPLPVRVSRAENERARVETTDFCLDHAEKPFEGTVSQVGNHRLASKGEAKSVPRIDVAERTKCN